MTDPIQPFFDEAAGEFVNETNLRSVVKARAASYHWRGRREVPCGSGRADLVLERGERTLVVEFKLQLADRRALFAGLRQLSRYRSHLATKHPGIEAFLVVPKLPSFIGTTWRAPGAIRVLSYEDFLAVVEVEDPEGC